MTKHTDRTLKPTANHYYLPIYRKITVKHVDLNVFIYVFLIFSKEPVYKRGGREEELYVF